MFTKLYFGTNGNNGSTVTLTEKSVKLQKCRCHPTQIEALYLYYIKFNVITVRSFLKNTPLHVLWTKLVYRFLLRILYLRNGLLTPK